jgi:hypothetical protein
MPTLAFEEGSRGLPVDWRRCRSTACSDGEGEGLVRESDAGPLRDLAEAVGARPDNGWGPETGVLLVSGGSHAGNAIGFPEIPRFTPGSRVHLIPLEGIATTSTAQFAVSPPWLKKVWLDPEAEGTD